MMILKDPLYGFISVDEPFKSLIETKNFQRLRNIKQLGLSNLVYPSANHSRFEHSIGAFYLAHRVAEKISPKSEKNAYAREFMAAALLHDIGHYPFSHAIEKFIGIENGASHERQTLNIIQNAEIAKILKKEKLDIGIICDLISGKGKYGKLIAGQIDVDRLDYLKRDSYYTGVAYGVIEADVIIKNLALKNKNYIFGIKYLPAMESILISRYMMYSMVYMHHKTLVANSMLRAAFSEALKAGEIWADQVIEFDDIDFISALRASQTPAKELVNQISNRRLYAEAIKFDKEDFDDFSKIRKIKNIAEIESLIAAELKIKNYEILINILNFPKTGDSKILISPSMESFEKISPMVLALDSAGWNYWFVGVYCPENCLAKVKKARNLIKRYLSGK